MADIINNPGDNRGGIGGVIAIILGIVLLILLLLVFFPSLFGREEGTAGIEERMENTDTSPEGAVVIPPPTVNNTTINSTSTINVGTTTDTDGE